MSFMTIQENIESLIEQEDLLEDIEKEAAFHDQVRKCRVKVQYILSKDAEKSGAASHAKAKA